MCLALHKSFRLGLLDTLPSDDKTLFSPPTPVSPYNFHLAAMRVLAALALAGAAAAQEAQWQVWRPSNTELIYGGEPYSVTTTATSGAAAYTGSAAYDPTTLTPPGVPDPAINTSPFVQLYSGGMTNLSIQQNGMFMGFSIEMSVATQIRECPFAFSTGIVTSFVRRCCSLWCRRRSCGCPRDPTL